MRTLFVLMASFLSFYSYAAGVKVSLEKFNEELDKVAIARKFYNDFKECIQKEDEDCIKKLAGESNGSNYESKYVADKDSFIEKKQLFYNLKCMSTYDHIKARPLYLNCTKKIPDESTIKATHFWKTHKLSLSHIEKYCQTIINKEKSGSIYFVLDCKTPFIADVAPADYIADKKFESKYQKDLTLDYILLSFEIEKSGRLNIVQSLYVSQADI